MNAPRSPLWMVVLSLVAEEPMHPYRIQVLIKQRGKDLIANVAQRNSVYQTIGALLRAGLIEVQETLRDERRPERVIYAATAEGLRSLRSWVRTALATPAREFPLFPAALATLDPGLSPDGLGELLEARVDALERRRAELESPVPGVPRIFLIESEYLAAIVRAEIGWLRRIVADLRSGRLAWPSEAELRRLAAMSGGPSQEAISRIIAEAPPASGSRRGRSRRPRRDRPRR